MKRKSFFKLGFAGGAVALINPLSACTTNSNKTIEKKSSFEVESSPFEEMNISDIHREMQNNRLNAETLCLHYLDRIKKIDQSGPTINSVICINPKALEEARALDREKFPFGPLHGIPILIKDNINTRASDGMPTTAGSTALLELWPTEDAPIVTKLRNAGAIILGKTNLSEWANFRSTNSTSGWSAVGGLTKNPHVLDRSACGSSSGSGASVAASLCQVAIGTETDGSIVCPSAINGIAGFKPTVGAVSRKGIVPISSSQDTAGPMARNVDDLIHCYDAISYNETNQNDIKSLDLPNNWKKTPNKSLSEATIGVCTNFLGQNKYVDEQFELIKNKLESIGTRFEEVTIDTSAYSGAEWQILQFEFKHELNAFLKTYGNEKTPQSLSELIDFNNSQSATEMPFFGQEIFESSDQKGDLSDSTYIEALKTAKDKAAKQIDELINNSNIDAFMAPTNGPSWVVDVINGDRFTGGSSSPAAVSGYPNVTIPESSVMGLPLGVSFFGKKWSDYQILAFALDFEKHIKGRVRPSYLKSLSPNETKVSIS